MASKASSNRPWIKKSKRRTKSKVLMKHRQEMIVYGYIRLSFKQRKSKKWKWIMPQEMMDMIYRFYEWQHISIALVGMESSGKSSLATTILYNLGYVTDDELNKLPNKQYSYYMDRSKEERKNNCTIHGTSNHEFDIGSHKYTLIDVPGKRLYLKNAVRLLSMADVAILVVPINAPAFTQSIQRPNTTAANINNQIEGSTKTHARICYVLGIEQLIVVFNKMDKLKSNYEDTYNSCKAAVNKILLRIGFKQKKIIYIPISVKNNENIHKYALNNDYLRFYKGFKATTVKKEKIVGHTLFDGLKYFIQPNNRFYINGIQKTFKMSISKTFYINNVGFICHGRIINGAISIKDSVIFNPSTNYFGIIQEIRINNQTVLHAECGSIVSVRICLNESIIKNKEKILNELRSQLLCLYDSISKNRIQPYFMFKKVKTFVALCYISNVPWRINMPRVTGSYHVDKHGKRTNIVSEYYDSIKTYGSGYKAIVFVSTWRAPCKLIKINWRKGRKTYNKRIDQDVKYCEQGDSAVE